MDKLTGSTLLAIHNGKDSGQEIPHVHVHLIPREPDDQAGPVHSMFKDRPKLSNDELDQLCAKIKSSLIIVGYIFLPDFLSLTLIACVGHVSAASIIFSSGAPYWL